MKYYRAYNTFHPLPDIASWFFSTPDNITPDDLKKTLSVGDVIQSLTEEEYTGCVRHVNRMVAEVGHTQTPASPGSKAFTDLMMSDRMIKQIQMNLFLNKEAASVLSCIDYPICVGYPKAYNVYRRNKDGNLIYVYSVV